MNRISVITTALGAALALVAPHVAFSAPQAAMDSGSNYNNATPPVEVKDSAITSSIKAALKNDSHKGLSHVRVDTDDHGIVTLEGKVRTQDAADRAVAIAQAAEGVRAVRSKIRIDADG